MKTIKIRFVQEGIGKDISYRIQKKKIIGFDNYRYSQCGGAGDCFYFPYRSKTKEDVLAKVISDVYETTIEHINVIEYPMIKIY